MSTTTTNTNSMTKAELLAKAKANVQDGAQALAAATAAYDAKVKAAQQGDITTGVAAARDKIEMLELRLQGLRDAEAAAQLEQDRDLAAEVAELLRQNVTATFHGRRLDKLEDDLTDLLRAIADEVDRRNAALLEAHRLISPLSDDSRQMLFNEYGIKANVGISRGIQIEGTVHESKGAAQVLERLIPNAIHAAGYRKTSLNL